MPDKSSGFGGVIDIGKSHRLQNFLHGAEEKSADQSKCQNRLKAAQRIGGRLGRGSGVGVHRLQRD